MHDNILYNTPQSATFYPAPAAAANAPAPPSIPLTATAATADLRSHSRHVRQQLLLLRTPAAAKPV